VAKLMLLNACRAAQRPNSPLSSLHHLKEAGMGNDRKADLRKCSGWAGWIAAAVLAAAPALALGADISWKSTTDSGTMASGKFTRLGAAVLSTGEKAELKLEGSEGAVDDKGRATVAVESVMRFKDGSSITTRHAGYRDPKTLETAGKGEFVSGTGRYQGISGQFTYTGYLGSTDSVGTYTLTK
jgi:hypothetical protein